MCLHILDVILFLTIRNCLSLISPLAITFNFLKRYIATVYVLTTTKLKQVQLMAVQSLLKMPPFIRAVIKSLKQSPSTVLAFTYKYSTLEHV